MFEHLVIFKFNAAITPEREQELIGKLLAFKGQIPGLVEVTAGLNVTEETDNKHGYSLGLRVTFESREALRAYGPHPLHQDFVKGLAGVLENVVVVDYPIQ
ncbi:Dabb family protein [Paenibacillus glycinis]|uniref:Dabb family protein n=1 Tax=Paenibacillus glycinis TaxID=2697035 RepID=A0ABW9XMZ9_9BACL|nr:Dabb family protein [Paenibacillus glycinis]NBD23816.1 Dabb family protein [Paenibacillus glycinis]